MGQCAKSLETVPRLEQIEGVAVGDGRQRRPGVSVETGESWRSPGGIAWNTAGVGVRPVTKVVGMVSGSLETAFRLEPLEGVEVGERRLKVDNVVGSLEGE